MCMISTKTSLSANLTCIQTCRTPKTTMKSSWPHFHLICAWSEMLWIKNAKAWASKITRLTLECRLFSASSRLKGSNWTKVCWLQMLRTRNKRIGPMTTMRLSRGRTRLRTLGAPIWKVRNRSSARSHLRARKARSLSDGWTQARLEAASEVWGAALLWTSH